MGFIGNIKNELRSAIPSTSMVCIDIGSETLKVIEGPVDFVLMDIWTEMARPAIELMGPHLRPGAVIVADNTTRVRHAYAKFLAYVDDPANGLRAMTLPFEGGLEFIVKT